MWGETEPKPVTRLKAYLFRCGSRKHSLHTPIFRKLDSQPRFGCATDQAKQLWILNIFCDGNSSAALHKVRGAVVLNLLVPSNENEVSSDFSPFGLQTILERFPCRIRISFGRQLRKTHTAFGRFHSLFDERDGRRIFVLERAHGETLAGTQMRPATDRATSAALLQHEDGGTSNHLDTWISWPWIMIQATVPPQDEPAPAVQP